MGTEANPIQLFLFEKIKNCVVTLFMLKSGFRMQVCKQINPADSPSEKL